MRAAPAHRGTLEPELKVELARRNGVELPYQTVDEMRAASDFDDLSSFLACYTEALDLTREELRQLQRNAFEISWLPRDARDAYLAELDAYPS